MVRCAAPDASFPLHTAMFGLDQSGIVLAWGMSACAAFVYMPDWEKALHSSPTAYCVVNQQVDECGQGLMYVWIAAGQFFMNSRSMAFLERQPT